MIVIMAVRTTSGACVGRIVWVHLVGSVVVGALRSSTRELTGHPTVDNAIDGHRCYGYPERGHSNPIWKQLSLVSMLTLANVRSGISRLPGCPRGKHPLRTGHEKVIMFVASCSVDKSGGQSQPESQRR